MTACCLKCRKADNCLLKGHYAHCDGCANQAFNGIDSDGNCNEVNKRIIYCKYSGAEVKEWTAKN